MPNNNYEKDTLINYVTNNFVASHEWLNKEIGMFDRTQPISDDMTVKEARFREENNLIAINNNIVMEGFRQMFLEEEKKKHDLEEALKVELLPCPCCGGKASFIDLEDNISNEKLGSLREKYYSYDLSSIKDLAQRHMFFHAVINSCLFFSNSNPKGIFCEQCHAFLPANHRISLKDVWFGIFAEEPEYWSRSDYKSEMNRICVSLWNNRGKFKSKMEPTSNVDYFVVNENTKPCPICGCTVCEENPPRDGISIMEFIQCQSCGFETVGIDDHRKTYENSTKINHKELRKILNWQRNCELFDKNKLKEFKQKLETMYSEVRRIHLRGYYYA